MNHQPIEHKMFADNGDLDVHSVFHTLQGEGPFAGRPATFIRLAGCNLQCPGCDTDYTSNRKVMNVGMLVRAVFAANPRAGQPGALVVITGGEPFRQNIEPLCAALLTDGIKVQIETNGTLPPPSLDFVERCTALLDHNAPGIFVVCSPKTGKVNPMLKSVIGAYKYVMSHDSVHPDDGLPLKALDHTAHPHVARPHEHYRGPVYLQPMDHGEVHGQYANQRSRAACVRSCLQYGYTMQLQTHKLLGLE